MSTNRIIADLVGTMKDTFRVGETRIKNVGAAVHVKNKADTAFASVAAAGVALKNTAGTKAITLVAPAAAANDVSFTLPGADGTTQQALVTDGSGKLSFATVAAGNNAMYTQADKLTFNDISAHTLFTPPVGAVIQTILVDVTEAFDGTLPELTVGVDGTPAKYVGTQDNDLTVPGVYELQINFTITDPAEPMTITLGGLTGATTGACDVYVTYSNPA